MSCSEKTIKKKISINFWISWTIQAEQNILVDTHRNIRGNKSFNTLNNASKNIMKLVVICDNKITLSYRGTGKRQKVSLYKTKAKRISRLRMQASWH